MVALIFSVEKFNINDISDDKSIIANVKRYIKESNFFNIFMSTCNNIVCSIVFDEIKDTEKDCFSQVSCIEDTICIKFNNGCNVTHPYFQRIISVIKDKFIEQYGFNMFIYNDYIKLVYNIQ